MTAVTFPTPLGGDGSTVTDDASTVTGLANGGHRARFVPALAQAVAVMSGAVAQATASQQAAAAAAGAALWVSGTTYAIGAAVWSPATYLIYRRRIAGAGTTDPSADATNWRLAVSVDPTLAVVTASAVTALASTHYVLTYAAGVTTVTLPASPVAGDAVLIDNATGRVDVLVARNGSLIEGAAADFTLDMPIFVKMRFIDSTRGWRFM